MFILISYQKQSSFNVNNFNEDAKILMNGLCKVCKSVFSYFLPLMKANQKVLN